MDNELRDGLPEGLFEFEVLLLVLLILLVLLQLVPRFLLTEFLSYNLKLII